MKESLVMIIFKVILNNGKGARIVKCLYKKMVDAIILCVNAVTNSVLFVYLIGKINITSVLREWKIGYFSKKLIKLAVFHL